jgi:hypothetical protein
VDRRLARDRRGRPNRRKGRADHGDESRAGAQREHLYNQPSLPSKDANRSTRTANRMSSADGHSGQGNSHKSYFSEASRDRAEAVRERVKSDPIAAYEAILGTALNRRRRECYTHCPFHRPIVIQVFASTSIKPPGSAIRAPAAAIASISLRQFMD